MSEHVNGGVMACDHAKVYSGWKNDSAPPLWWWICGRCMMRGQDRSDMCPGPIDPAKHDQIAGLSIVLRTAAPVHDSPNPPWVAYVPAFVPCDRVKPDEAYAVCGQRIYRVDLKIGTTGELTGAELERVRRWIIR